MRRRDPCRFVPLPLAGCHSPQLGEERGGDSADYVAYRYGAVGLQTVVRAERSLEVPDPERLLCGTDKSVGFRRRYPRRQVRVVTQVVVGPGADDVARN